MIKVGIVGGSGYAGSNTIKLLENRDDVTIEIVTSGSLVGKKVSSNLDLKFSPLDFDKLNLLDNCIITYENIEKDKRIHKTDIMKIEDKSGNEIGHMDILMIVKELINFEKNHDKLNKVLEKFVI